MTKKIILVALALGVLTPIPKDVGAFDFDEILEDAGDILTGTARGVYELLYTPCERHDRKVADRIKRRKEWLKRFDSIEAERRTIESSAKRQQRAKRRAEIQELLRELQGHPPRQPPRQPSINSLILLDLMQEENLREELRLLQEADERAKVCGE